MPRSPRSRAYSWTLNNWTQQEKDHLMNLNMEENGIKYLCWGEEIAPTTGTAHLQGYVYFVNKRTMSVAHHILGSRIAFLQSQGSPEQNRAYCSKTRPQDVQQNAVFVERGELPRKGKRNDLEAIQKELDEGSTLERIARDHFGQWVIYRKSFEAYAEMVNKRVNDSEYSLESFGYDGKEEILEELGSSSIIIWGKAGTGKTEFAKALMPGALLVSHLDDLRLFEKEKYSGIIFDDMCFTHLPRTSQIHLVDSDNGRSIHCRYQTAWIPRNTKKIFTTNEQNGEVVDLNDPAIARRCRCFRVRSNLFS